MTTNGFNFRAKDQDFPEVCVEQRLNAETVAIQEQPPLAHVPDCNGKHAVELVGEKDAILFIRMDYSLRVAVGLESMALRLKFLAQFNIIEDLAVDDDMD